jgi:hypothetical protein
VCLRRYLVAVIPVMPFPITATRRMDSSAGIGEVTQALRAVYLLQFFTGVRCRNQVVSRKSLHETWRTGCLPEGKISCLHGR